ncbi:glycoside hydrolase family 105 protein [Amycolatopsis umgeniensis]|uniref:Unsaturated rhamnogalacturonyl hydrolase n=1 Tax=Amycolatopsis umgeniensis TaxID=336628 RepID=A0A841B915_9PSEU|nr:glycoside hydrolase family 88 protein [Amycolatopsis umgeniensis]MBB5855797.1 unsaturated rhamnogalacturonyl hydrolase [Amycolatopsis umgeniensis]
MSPDPLRAAGLSRRTVLAGTAGALGALALPGTATAAPVDWSRAVVDSTMKRYTPATLGGWGYTRGLYLYGQYLVYRRTGEKPYLDYILAWYDRFVTESGISNGFTNLDAMRSGQMFPLLYTETGQAKYKTAAKQLREKFPSYPRTSDGGMFHATGKTGQLWADGVYMAQPFLALYGKTFGDPAYCYEEAAKNVTVYFDRLKEPTKGLLYHAYDEDGSEPWASGDGRHSKYHWARAIGWLGMTAIDLLEILPAGHPRRKRLVDIVRFLAAGYTRWQDRASGRWFQIVDRGGDKDNWLETSASAMYTFLLSRAVERGHIGAEYRPVAAKGHTGVLSQISAGADGLADIKNISEGTNVGDTAYYYARKRNTNDFHGLGAFLIMNEQLAFPSGAGY